MNPSPLATRLAIALSGIVLLAALLVSAARHGNAVTARERELAARPAAYRAAEDKDSGVVLIPVTPAFVERRFPARKLLGWEIRTENMEILEPFQQPEGMLLYQVTGSDGVPYERAADGQIYYDPRDSVTIKVSRAKWSEPVFLYTKTGTEKTRFGIYGGPVGNLFRR